MKKHHSAIVVIVSLVLSTAVLLAQDTAKLVNKWVFSYARLTDRAECVAYTQKVLTEMMLSAEAIAEARKQGISQAQIDEAPMRIRQELDKITEEDINKQSKGGGFSFKDDQSVSVSRRSPTGE